MFASDSSKPNLYDPKTLRLELMEEVDTTSRAVKPVLLGEAEINLSLFADKNKEHAPVDVALFKHGTRVGVLVIQVEATDADSKKRFNVEGSGYDTDGTWDLDQSVTLMQCYRIQ